jgi:RNA recognition motif-containing protein
MSTSSGDQPTGSFAATISSRATEFHGIKIFIGNLSFFCEEKDLMEYTQSKVAVESVRICRSQRRGNSSLCYGFVLVKDTDEAHALTRSFDGSLFMGRRLR